MECKRFAELDYWVYTPENPRKNLPLVVFLHGIGERGPDPETIFQISLPKWLRQGRWAPDAWVICPQCPADVKWVSQLEKLKALIDHEVGMREADTKRVSITGLSMGGFGTWAMGIRYPELFSAMAPICGGADGTRAERLKDMPIRTFHGEKDAIVPVSKSLEIVELVKKAGGNPELTLYPNLAHNCWDEAYGNTDVLAWLLAQSK